MVDYAGSVEATLRRVHDLFGQPIPIAPGAQPSTGGPGQTGWTGAAAEREQGAVRALDDRRTNLISADRGLDSWARDAANDSANGRDSAKTLIGSAQQARQTLNPYQGTLAGRVALIQAMSSHADAAGRLVAGSAATIAERRQALAALAAEYGLIPRPNGQPGSLRRPRRRPGRRMRRAGGMSPARYQMAGGFGQMASQLPKLSPSGFGGSTGGFGGFGGGGLPRIPSGLDSGGAGLTGDGSLGMQAVKNAAEKLGTIYKWGGHGGPKDGGRVDCSGLMYYAYKKLGVDIGLDTFTQITKGVQVQPSQIRPGDMVFCYFGTQGGNPGPGHVVMATGYGANSQIIEASKDGEPVAFGRMPQGRIVVKRVIP
ncbi:C40 family peptidase [Mycobacteroides abscessus]|uniref:C40 family peptidase n=1 Tax=Mycobacteroides abscessus TaxID=36809 RepID=UPI0009D593D1|nr:NlpC/P60 family protein [Mycobacteroides abscessus]SKH88032.1 putative NLP/P60 protein [Mycobacteroides abscessus subsp. massiliense]SKH92060.1 putative NLP/P60 protein [Mycobacteroides abscessus subsp. massiliense]SKI12606.1 putative NLP/P60 protein [Mycobacteroides abscessus subsp. massiliense]SKK21522.1 putative NLP/P60 protein [Mycobacteroides abscessus subsp. massiliense]SKK31669.1 putative NLP/P60 protein [Mycobacteroides abscessus subsp. massiliense]